MPIIYTKHLIESIDLRNIKKDFVVICVSKPDKILQATGNKKAYFKDFGVNYLKVIVVEEGFDLVVITAYWFAKTRLKT